jgi:hypothetical protein
MDMKRLALFTLPALLALSTPVIAQQPWHAPHALVWHQAHGRIADTTTGDTGTWSVTAYTMSGPTPAPPGATVYSPAQIAGVKAMELRSQARHASSCTRGCGYWNFGCPATITGDVKWDETDDVGLPLYHQEMLAETGNNCRTVWTYWRDVQHCQIYAPGGSCVQPIANGQFWQPGWLTNWTDTQFKFQPIYAPWVCNIDTLDLRLNFGPKGGVWGEGYPPGETNC